MLQHNKHINWVMNIPLLGVNHYVHYDAMKIMNIKFILNSLLRTSCLLFLSASCFSDNKNINQIENILSEENEPFFNIIFGISPFSGLLGFEYQKGHNAFGFSPLKRISYRYYNNPYQDTKFWGIYLGSYSRNRIDTNEYYSLHGINYDKIKSSFVGAGIGYRWQWVSGWNTSVSIALEFAHNVYSNPGESQNAKENEIFPFPGLNAGYKF